MKVPKHRVEATTVTLQECCSLPLLLDRHYKRENLVNAQPCLKICLQHCAPSHHVIYYPILSFAYKLTLVSHSDGRKETKTTTETSLNTSSTSSNNNNSIEVISCELNWRNYSIRRRWSVVVSRCVVESCRYGSIDAQLCFHMWSDSFNSIDGFAQRAFHCPTKNRSVCDETTRNAF